MKRKTERGFTLIELIIVIALLSIIMGAILQLMGPIRQVYSTTLNTVNTKTASETMIDFIEDKTRYATDMLILKDYEGIPQINPTSGGAAKVGNSTAAFTNVIIIDNNHLRGTMLKDFVGNTTATRKNCRGTLYTMGNIGDKDYLDISKLSMGTLGEGILGDYTYEMDVFAATNKDRKTLTLAVDVFNMKYDSTAAQYVKDEKQYTTDRKFDLVNINLDKDDSYTLSGAIDFGTAADYGKYPRQTAPSAFTGRMAEMFNSANKYTFIFYGIKSTNDSLQYSVTFKYEEDPSWSNGGKNLGTPRLVNAGKKLLASYIPTPVTRADMEWKFVDETGNPVSEDEIADRKVTGDTVYTVEYYASGTSTQKYKVKYIYEDGTPVFGQLEYDTAAGTTLSPATPSSVEGRFNTDTQYAVWYNQTTNKSLSEQPVSVSAGGVTLVCKIFNKCKVNFSVLGVVDEVNYTPQYLMPGEKASNPSKIPDHPSDNTKKFSKWAVGTTALEDYEVNADTTFDAVFVDKPAAVNGWTLSYTAQFDSIDNNVWDGSANVTASKYNVNLSFTTADSSKYIDDLAVKITLNKPSSLIGVYNVSITGNGTKYITVSPTLWNRITNNGTNNLNNSPLKFKGDDITIENIEIVRANGN